MKKDICVSTAYLAPIEYYAHMVKSQKVVVEVNDNYVKQTYRNRCVISTANGVQHLSIPVEKPHNQKCLTKDLRISNHGNWQHTHWNAIESAYNNTPFFEYYKDYFKPIYDNHTQFLVDFNFKLMETVCYLIDIEAYFDTTKEFYDGSSDMILDLRSEINPKRKEGEYTEGFMPVKYYQVFDDKHGFLSNLSIIDLLFNMGPESLIILNQSIGKPDV